MADPPPPPPPAPPPLAADGKPSAADAQPKFLNSAKPAPEALWWSRRAWDLLSRLRARVPLVQCITNFVSMDLMANTLLALGASPAMVHSIHEVTDFTPRVDAVLVNVGTLTDTWLPSMRAAAVAAMAAGRPWVLDPVAVSVSEFRMKACLGLLDLRPSVIRGNASEVLALSAACRLAESKGADSSHDSVDAGEAARSLARKSGAVVAVSGAVDFVTDGHRVVGARNGVAMMQKITATGCSVTAVIAAFVAMDPANAFEATTCALSIYGLAGELGMDMAKGPASLRMHMIDSLHGLDEQTVMSRVSIVQFAMQSSSQPSQPTQPSQTPSQQESGIRRRGGNFSTEEDVHLVSAWLNTPYDSVLQGNDLKHKTYWSRVMEFYHKYKNFQSDRNENSLMNRWSQIQIASHRFCQCFAQIEASAPAHMSGEDKISNARRLYQETTKKQFQFDHAWIILRNQAKWLEEGQKKRPKTHKSTTSSSSTPGTPIDLEEDDLQNDYVDLERPPGSKPEKERSSKRKAKDRATDSTNSPVISFLHEMKEDKRQFNEKKMDMFEKTFIQEQERVALDKMRVEIEQKRICHEDKIRLEEQRKEEERIMLIDTTGMPPMVQEFYRRRQKEILAKGVENS